ncbi:MAG: FkbM family methyltransferase [Planctomycetota bacterium]|jgi:FkbM family methyltransferase|nr:FkbM family methyltransferase [Planctomycetota bacterium]
MDGSKVPALLDSHEYASRWRSRYFGFLHYLRGRFHRKFRKDVEILRNFIPEASLVVDAGSNHGRFAIEVADLYSGRDRCFVHAFEPVTYNFNVQSRVLAGRDKVIGHHFGLSDVSDEFDIYIPLKPNGELFHGGAFIAEENEFLDRAEGRTDKAYVKQSVSCNLLDSILEGRSTPVSFIKIDVEGHELQVLRGAANLLASDKPTLFMESRGEEDPLRFLANIGYRFFDLDLCDDGRWTESPGVIRSGIVDSGKHHDVLCWHPSRSRGKQQAPLFAIPFAQTRFGT